MSYTIEAMRDYPLTLGSLTLHLAQYKLTGACIVREQGTASGNAVVCAIYPKGSRMTLRGRLSPDTDTGMTGQTLCAMMRAGATLSAAVGGMVLPSARIIGFSIEESEGAPEVMVVLFTENGVQKEAST